MTESEYSEYSYDYSDYSDDSEVVVYTVGQQIQLKFEFNQFIVPRNNKYIMLTNKQCCLIDKNLVVERVESHACGRPRKIVFYQNRYIVQTITHLCYLKECSLEQFSESYYISNIYVLNGELYGQKNDAVYIFTNNHFKLIRFQPSSTMYLRQFCNLSYSFDQNQSQLQNKVCALYKYDSNGKQLMCTYQELMMEFFNLQNIIIFSTQDGAFIFNLVSQQIIKLDQIAYEKLKEEIDDQIELGAFGFQLKKERQIELFGEQVYQQSVEMFQQWTCDEGKPFEKQSEHENKLAKYQLMHVFKPFYYADLYISIEDNTLFVVDKDLNILEKTEIKCELYSGLQDEQYDALIIFEGYFSQAVLCNGRIHIQIRNKVYYLKDRKLQLLVEIPDFEFGDTNSYYNAIFSLNDDLYVKNLDEYYVFKDNQLQLVDKMEMWVFQSNSQVFMYQDEGDIIVSELVSAKEKRHITTMPSEDYCTGYMLNRIMVSQHYETRTLLTDLQTGAQVEIGIDQHAPFKYIELGGFGLQFSQSLVQQHFGNIYDEQTALYTQFMKQQMKYPCYLEEILKIIPFKLILQQVQSQIYVKIQAITGSLTNLRCNVVQKQLQASELVETQINIQNRMALSLESFVECQVNQ
ncbi:Conserved_hypothetical protein [Hexamita inflata]|uniref:Uncharacterized protein n=1 Tax=Hexamita inflata TaxID=28002 RepID=A0AA86NET0_9EUKA|nr:Conserved hypothetical protein [Hexamita inflata]